MDTETQNCVTILEENWLHVRNIDDVDKRASQTNLENKTYDSKDTHRTTAVGTVPSTVVPSTVGAAGQQCGQVQTGRWLCTFANDVAGAPRRTVVAQRPVVTPLTPRADDYFSSDYFLPAVFVHVCYCCFQRHDHRFLLHSLMFLVCVCGHRLSRCWVHRSGCRLARCSLALLLCIAIRYLLGRGQFQGRADFSVFLAAFVCRSVLFATLCTFHLFWCCTTDTIFVRLGESGAMWFVCFMPVPLTFTPQRCRYIRRHLMSCEANVHILWQIIIFVRNDDSHCGYIFIATVVLPGDAVRPDTSRLFLYVIDSQVEWHMGDHTFLPLVFFSGSLLAVRPLYNAPRQADR